MTHWQQGALLIELSVCLWDRIVKEHIKGRIEISEQFKVHELTGASIYWKWIKFGTAKRPPISVCSANLSNNIKWALIKKVTNRSVFTMDEIQSVFVEPSGHAQMTKSYLKGFHVGETRHWHSSNKHHSYSQTWWWQAYILLDQEDGDYSGKMDKGKYRATPVFRLWKIFCTAFMNAQLLIQ